MQLMLMLSAIFAALSVIIIRLGRILDHLEAKAARQKEQPKGKGHDAWVQAALASGDDEEIRHLQAYWPLSRGCPIPMSEMMFTKLHSYNFEKR